MKTQMTTIAAAVALTMSAAAMAQTAPSWQFNGSRADIDSMGGSLYNGSAVGSDSQIEQNGNFNSTSVTQWGYTRLSHQARGYFKTKPTSLKTML